MYGFFSPHQAILQHQLGVLQLQLNQFWHYLPGVNIRSDRLRDQANQPPSDSLSDANLKSWLLSVLLTHQLLKKKREKDVHDLLLWSNVLLEQCTEIGKTLYLLHTLSVYYAMIQLGKNHVEEMHRAMNVWDTRHRDSMPSVGLSPASTRMCLPTHKISERSPLGFPGGFIT